MLLVAGLAFALAAFPARNSDLLLHLAAGRELVPFASGEVAREIQALDAAVGRAWLFNVVTFRLYDALGGSGLVFVKALVVAALATLLVWLCRSGNGWWLPALCAALAMLALSPYLQLRPVTISCVLLALVLWALRRQQKKHDEQKSKVYAIQGEFTDSTESWRPPMSLLALFLVWANVDRWSILGLGVAALVWLGKLVDARRGEPSLGAAARRRATWLIALAIICLLNPADLILLGQRGSWTGFWPGAADGFGAPRTVTAPFQSAYLATAGSNPAAWAYFALLGLGLMSFLMRVGTWRWTLFLPWAFLAGLSTVEIRVIPFFAILAGPVLARNLEATIVSRYHGDPRRNFRPLAGVAACWLAGLLVCAWPGLLHGPPYEPRRWAVEPAPSLPSGALTVRRWLEDGRLRSGMCALHLTPESAAAFAWFCPDARGVFDRELAERVRNHVGESSTWEEPLRAAGIDYVVVYDADRQRLLATLEQLLSDPAQWPLLAIQGDLIIFGWRSGPAHESFADLELNLDRLAFHPEIGQRAPNCSAGAAPAQLQWWQAFWKRAPARSLDNDAAAMHLLLAEALRRTAPQRHLAAWETGQAAALVGTSAGWRAATVPASVYDAAVHHFLFRPPLPGEVENDDRRPALDRVPPLTDHVLGWQQQFTRRHDDSPSALLYLAIRAARRALAIEPNDARAWHALGESYLRLLHNTRERDWARHFPELVDLRHAQAATALARAAALKPDLAPVHFHLGALYTEIGYLDLALRHRRTYLELVRGADPPPGVSARHFKELLVQAEQELTKLARIVESRRDEFTKGSTGKRVADRAELAERLGLADKALEILLASDVAAFGSAGLTLELKLLLATGRVNEILAQMEPVQKESLGSGRYHWLRARALAAVGDYSAAQQECGILAAGAGDRPADPARSRESIAALAGQALLDGVPGVENVPAAAIRASRQADFGRRLMTVITALRRQADATVLRGLLTLEEGDDQTAAAAFRLALELSGDAREGSGFGFAGRSVAIGCLKWVE